MAVPPDDRRPPLAVAMEMVSQITSVALSMALPAGAGYWVDRQFGTSPWLLVLGAGLGLVIGMLQLLRVPGGKQKRQSDDSQQGVK